MSDDTYKYDVFISYSSKDKAWVRGDLLTQLEASGLTVCIDFRDFGVGLPSIEEMQRAVLESRKMLAVLTPNYLQSGWTNFETLMQRTLDLSAQQERYIPVLKDPCELPLSISYLTLANFVDPHDWPLEWNKLLTALGASRPHDLPLKPIILADNPFTDSNPIKDPKDFFSRPQIIREIRQLLETGHNVWLTGEPQVGKSSLLNYLYETQAEWKPGRKTVCLNLQAIEDIGDFCGEVLLKMGVSGDTLRLLRNTLRNEPLLLLLDEVQDLVMPEFSGRLQGFLRTLVQEGHLHMVVASRHSLSVVFPATDSTSPLHNVFTPLSINPFNEEEMNAFFDTRLGDRAALFTPDERHRLYQETSGHPARVQRAAETLFKQKVGA